MIRYIPFMVLSGISLVGLVGVVSAFEVADGKNFDANGGGLTALIVPEPMRSEPTVSIRLRDMQAANREDISLRIPERYIKLGDAEGVATITGPLAFYLTYPDMIGGREKKNRDIPYCRGGCRGLTQVTIYNSSVAESDVNARLNDYINNKKKYIVKRSGSFASIHEEYNVMWRRFPFRIWRGSVSGDNSKSPATEGVSEPVSFVPPPGYVTAETYKAYLKNPWPAAHIFVFRRMSGSTEIVECKGNLLNLDETLCEYHGRSSKTDRLKYRISFPYKTMGDWPNFLQSVSQLIDGFVVQ